MRYRELNVAQLSASCSVHIPLGLPGSWRRDSFGNLWHKLGASSCRRGLTCKQAWLLGPRAVHLPASGWFKKSPNFNAVQPKTIAYKTVWGICVGQPKPCAPSPCAIATLSQTKLNLTPSFRWPICAHALHLGCAVRMAVNISLQVLVCLSCRTAWPPSTADVLLAACRGHSAPFPALALDRDTKTAWQSHQHPRAKPAALYLTNPHETATSVFTGRHEQFFKRCVFITCIRRYEPAKILEEFLAVNCNPCKGVL